LSSADPESACVTNGSALLFPLVLGAPAPFVSSSHGLAGGGNHLTGATLTVAPARNEMLLPGHQAGQARGALSSAVMHEEVVRSDEQIEGLTFERCGISPAHRRRLHYPCNTLRRCRPAPASQVLTGERIEGQTFDECSGP